MYSDEYDRNYNEFHQRLLNAFIEQAAHQQPFCSSDCSQDDQEFLHNLQQLAIVGDSDKVIQGQELLCRIVSSYPQLMPLLPRDLLWFFGGDCLHYMPDEEITLFQSLDEQRQEAKEAKTSFSYEHARAVRFGLH
ncbi:MAG TPA: PA2817 family protein [Cellvibrio sp.]|nr:PA2817 family protein [Cellvibrio sp.]